MVCGGTSVAANRVRRQPQRTCIACRRVADKRDLVRVVSTPEGRLVVDPKGKLPGRGAYVCRGRACWGTVRRGGALRRALRLEGSESDRMLVDLSAIDAFFEQLPESDDRG